MDRAAQVLRAAFDRSLPWLAGRHTPEEDRSFFRERLFVECAIWGAVEDAVVGIIAFRPGWIDQLYVLPERQRRGIGRALLDVAKTGSPGLELWTFQRNRPARRFYEKNGFTAVRETDGAENEEREPDMLYAWRP